MWKVISIKPSTSGRKQATQLTALFGLVTINKNVQNRPWYRCGKNPDLKMRGLLQHLLRCLPLGLPILIPSILILIQILWFPWASSSLWKHVYRASGQRPQRCVHMRYLLYTASFLNACPMPGLVFLMERVNCIVAQTQVDTGSTCNWIRSGGTNLWFDILKTNQGLSWYETFLPVSLPDLKLLHSLGLFLCHASPF